MTRKELEHRFGEAIDKELEHYAGKIAKKVLRRILSNTSLSALLSSEGESRREQDDSGAGLIHPTIPDVVETEPRPNADAALADFDLWVEKAKWFKAGRRSAFTYILGQIAESCPDLVRVCPCENPYCSEAVHRNGRVKPDGYHGTQPVSGASGSAQSEALKAHSQSTPASPERRETVEQAKAHALCPHPHRNRTGGNDYIRCGDCGFEWDYRRVHDPAPHAIDALIAAVRQSAERRGPQETT